jgi:hypothetical protein
LRTIVADPLHSRLTDLGPVIVQRFSSASGFPLYFAFRASVAKTISRAIARHEIQSSRRIAFSIVWSSAKEAIARFDENMLVYPPRNGNLPTCIQEPSDICPLIQIVTARET